MTSWPRILAISATLFAFGLPILLVDQYLPEPVLIVQVLSLSTEDHDRGHRLAGQALEIALRIHLDVLGAPVQQVLDAPVVRPPDARDVDPGNDGLTFSEWFEALPLDPSEVRR